MKSSELLLAAIGISVVTLVVRNQIPAGDSRPGTANAHAGESIKEPRPSDDGWNCLQDAATWKPLQRRGGFETEEP
jgi:hypothetical protein